MMVAVKDPLSTDFEKTRKATGNSKHIWFGWAKLMNDNRQLQAHAFDGTKTSNNSLA